MTERRSIFRAGAWERHLRARQVPVLPRYLQPRLVSATWLLVAALLLACWLMWSVERPAGPGSAERTSVRDLLPGAARVLSPGP